MSGSYSRDIYGRRVLTGLTFAETNEFETLDRHSGMNANAFTREVLAASEGAKQS